ncbi:MAG: hypothetical protein ACXABV_10675 [Candidatus Thorarchaeota archaeon]|jgi:hypothetical protein
MPEQPNDIKELGHRLVVHAYPEFDSRDFTINTGNLRSYGQVRWGDVGGIQITCHQDVIRWPEPVLIGLLAHEISHPAEGSSSEEGTDRDVIDRGLGHYLAVERAFVNKYDDHSISRGKDRYLGFQSVRKLLNGHEERIMENLLEDFRILPSKETTKFRLLHDTAIHDGIGHSILMIEGQSIRVEGARPNSDIKLLFRDEILYVFVDDEVGAQIPWHER